MKLVRIAPGEFVMGAGRAAPKTREEWDRYEWDEAPAHKVTITKPFYMGITEVTNAVAGTEDFSGAVRRVSGHGWQADLDA